MFALSPAVFVASAVSKRKGADTTLGSKPTKTLKISQRNGVMHYLSCVLLIRHLFCFARTYIGGKKHDTVFLGGSARFNSIWRNQHYPFSGICVLVQMYR